MGNGASVNPPLAPFPKQAVQAGLSQLGGTLFDLAVKGLPAAPTLEERTGAKTSSTPLRRSITLSPRSTFVFLLGICGEWQDGRATEGDIALYEALRHACGIPEEHICHIKDARGTKANVLRQLERFLSRTGAGDTLEIYFGGHGSTHGVATFDGKLWKYIEMIQQIESQFGGDRAVFLMDTCHAGSLGKHLFARSKILRVSYAFVGATQSDSVTGGQWTLTSSLIDAVRGKAGLDRYNDGVIDFADFVSYTADRHAREKKNRISIRLFGQFRPNTVLFTISNVAQRAPARALWPGGKQSFSVNNKAFVKYEGGYVRQREKQEVYIPPNWYPCTVRRMEPRVTAVVDAVDEFGNAWRISSSPPNLLPGNYFSAAIQKESGLIEGVFSNVFRAPIRIFAQAKRVAKSVAEIDHNVRSRCDRVINKLPAQVTQAAENNVAAKALLTGTVGAMAVGAELIQRNMPRLAHGAQMFDPLGFFDSSSFK